MKLLLFLVLQIFVINACSAEAIVLNKAAHFNDAPDSLKNLINEGKSSCTITYNNREIWVVENHCTENIDEQGIYIIDKTGIRKLNWFDKSFNEWAWLEGCNTEKDCYYKVNIDNKGKVIEISYYFYINLSEGHYKLHINNNKLIITEKKIVDHPS